MKYSVIISSFRLPKRYAYKEQDKEGKIKKVLHTSNRRITEQNNYGNTREKQKKNGKLFCFFFTIHHRKSTVIVGNCTLYIL